jgi:Mitochondrial degradasome RNA helicase subunit C terminal
VYCHAPARYATDLRRLRSFAKQFRDGGLVGLGMGDVTVRPPRNATQMQRIEELHSGTELYLWLAQRYPSQFNEVHEAQQLRGALETTIEAGLERLSAVRPPQPTPGRKKRKKKKNNNRRNNNSGKRSAQ